MRGDFEGGKVASEREVCVDSELTVLNFVLSLFALAVLGRRSVLEDSGIKLFLYALIGLSRFNYCRDKYS